MTLSAIGLTDSHIIVGNSSNLGADVAMSGSIQINDTGATSINPSSTDAIPSPWTATTQSASDSSTKIATTAFVQTVVGAITAGLDSRPSCRVATTAALTATYSNGSSGVGATLTNSGTKAAISIDGVSLAVNDRVLVHNQSTTAQNGIYTVTTVGSGSVNWVLTRATDFNTASATGVVEGAFTVIEEGTALFGTFWIETGEGPFTIGTTAITFTQLQVTNVNLTNGDILVGNASNIAAAVSMSGDVTITNAGVTSIKSSVALAGSPTTTTQSAGDNSTKIATTAYVDSAVSGAGVSYNAIAGCLPSSMAGTHTTATMTVSAGQAADSTNAVYITGAGYSWAVSNGNAINGYQGGTTLPNSSTIHMYLCTGASGTGTFASTSLTPTLPTGYAVSYRRIFSFNTNSSGAPIPYTAFEAEGGSLICYLTTQILDISTTTLGTTQTLYTLTVPTGIKVSPIMRIVGDSSSTIGVILTSGDETNVAPTSYAGTTAPLWDVAGVTVAVTMQPYLTTNTSGQVGARSSAANAVLYGATRGFKDFRRA